MFLDKDGGKLEQKVVLSNAERKTVEQMTQDSEEQRELATNRLAELEKTSGLYKDALKEVERLKMELSTLPEHVVVETTEHKCLQSQFSVLYNEAMQLKTQLEDSRNQLQVILYLLVVFELNLLNSLPFFQMVKNAHLRQIEQMESEELMTQKKLRTEVIQLEDMLAQVRKEYEMLRIEFEQNLAANEQTGPINKEMRNLIKSLQTHNNQLKGEVARYKRKCKEASLEKDKLRKDLDDMKTAEIKALQIKKEQMLSKAASADELTMNNSNVHLNDTNSQDGSSPNYHENNHEGAIKSGNGNNSDSANAEPTDESSNGLIKVNTDFPRCS